MPRLTSSLLKKSQMSARQGEDRRNAAVARPWALRHLGVLPGSAVYTLVCGCAAPHFEPIRNAESRHLSVFQHAV